jgi:Zn-dependent protease with chaperone function
MKFTPRELPPDAADASAGQDRHPLRELTLLVAGIGIIATVLYVALLLVSDIVIRRISPAREAKWFASFGNILPAPDQLEPVIQERFDMAGSLLERLLPHADLDVLPVKLRVWDTPHTNAVALPGGTIALTVGLLECLDEEPGMAFVLAHELGHFHGRDHLRGLSRQLGLQLIWSLLFSGNAEVATGAGPAAQLTILSYSRDRESAADRYALRLVSKTLPDAEGSLRLFELLRNEKLPGWAYMFATHQSPDERIADLKRYADEKLPAPAR